MKLYPQISLRELLVVVFCAGLGLAALVRAGGVLSSIVGSLVIVAAMCLAILVFVAKGQLRAFAVGFLAPAVIYGAAVYMMGEKELDAYQGKLPTSRLLQPLFSSIVKVTWVNVFTGEADPDYDPAKDPQRLAGGGGFVSSPMSASENPDRGSFMTLGHLLFAILFGYVGAKFAVVVHRRQHEPAPK